MELLDDLDFFNGSLPADQFETNGTNFTQFDLPPGHSDPPSAWFFVYGFGITAIAILGVFGNLLSALVLSRPQMRSSVSCLLLGLAFCDTLLISTSILIFGLPAISDYSGTLLFYRLHVYPLWVPYLFPVSISAQTGSVYLTLSVTVERYVAVCYSLHARSLCTWSRARACVGLVLLLAAAYNAPRWFEVCTVRTKYTFEDNSSVYENVMCPLRSAWAYKTYYINWSYLLVMYLIPFLGLVILNWAIYQQVRRANLARAALSKLQRREMGLATMLLFVVCVFLLCNVLPLVNNVLESFYDQSFDVLIQISNFLVIFNSSVNFVIYCTCGERFRRRLVRLCKEWGWRVRACFGFQGESANGSRAQNAKFACEGGGRGRHRRSLSLPSHRRLSRSGLESANANAESPATGTIRLMDADLALTGARREMIVSFTESGTTRTTATRARVNFSDSLNSNSRATNVGNGNGNSNGTGEGIRLATLRHGRFEEQSPAFI